MKKVLALICLLALLQAPELFAEESGNGISLDEIVVTPYRYDEELARTPSSITLITQDDIRNSSAFRVADVLRLVPGLIVKDWYGNAVKASVDIAGFGEQGALNVLVLIDGRRINDVDLSGADLTQVPLGQVEKIEIIRGGSGSVLYGDNAASGVINIITKKPFGKLKTEIETRYGSYDMNAQKISLGGAGDKLSYWVSGSREATHGYRNNSFFKANNFASKFSYDINDVSSLRFGSGSYVSTFGLPASLNQSVIDQFTRRFARNGDDHANNKDYYYLIGSKNDFGNSGIFDIDLSYRRKKTDSYFLTSGLFTTRNMIKTFGITPKYTLKNRVLGCENSFIMGLDYYLYDYSSNKHAISDDALQNFTDINRVSIGGYLQDEFFLIDKLVLVGGYRHETSKYEFDYHDDAVLFPNPDIDKNVRMNKNVFNAGLVFTYLENSNLFFNINRSFRFPEVDEFTFFDANFQQQLNTDLKPQVSTNYQMGLRHQLSERIKLDFSLFRMNVRDELYLNSTGGPLGFGQNENYDKTIHEGIEFAFDSKIKDSISVFGNYLFTKAFFEGGQFGENNIPLVPKHKGSVGFRFAFPKNITLNFIGTYVGKRRLLNDQANAFSRLNGYMIADLNIAYRLKDLEISFSVNNLFNKRYSEFAGVTVSNGVKFYYPSPERNFTLKLEYKF